jgi:hypothetical protein
MIGGGFQHDICSCAHNNPTYVEWVKDRSASISVHVDDAVFSLPVDKSKMNIAWFAESPYFTRMSTSKFNDQSLKSYILENFQLVVSCDKEFVKKHPEVKYVIPTARPWVKDKQIFPKTKWASIIASAKRTAPGHQFRHIIIDQYKENLDIFGGGYAPIDDKGEGLNEYFYSFAIENIIADGYFTEKISDCFATGTIPIYWGDETVSEYFLKDGIVNLNNEDFDPNILTEEYYNDRKDVIKENFNRSINLPIPEDEIYLKYLK